MKGWIALVLAATFPGAALAQQHVMGKDLYNWCTSTDAGAKALCDAYLSGTVEGLGLGQQLGKIGTIYCMNNGIDIAQELILLKKTARQYPALLDKPAEGIVAKSLLDAYPCPK